MPTEDGAAQPKSVGDPPEGIVHTQTQMMVMSTSQPTLWRYFSGSKPGRSGAGPRASTGPTQATGDSANFGARGRQSRTTGQTHSTGSTPLTVVQWNAEGIRNKKPELQEFLHRNKVDVVCVQETHLNETHRFFVRGFELFRQDRATGHKGGVLTLVRNNIPAVETQRSAEGTELVSVKLLLQHEQLTITNCYCPPTSTAHFENITVEDSNHLLVGDFNGHSPSWGYPTLNSRGEEIEDFMITNKLTLINLPKDPPSYYSRAWKTLSTPDLAMATDNIHKHTTRTVNDQIGGSDHRPITISIDSKHPNPVPRKEPSWNFKKANWSKYKMRADQLCLDINFSGNIHQNATLLTGAILQSAKESIPRGRRKDYQPFWSKELDELHKKLTSARTNMEGDPSLEHIRTHNNLKEELDQLKKQETQKSWFEKTKSLNMEKDTTKLWKLTKVLNEDSTTSHSRTVIEENSSPHTGRMAANILADAFQEYSQLEMPKQRVREANNNTKESLRSQLPEESMMNDFSMQELSFAMKKLKTKKAPGKDGIMNDMIMRLGFDARRKVLSLFNQSWRTGKLPNQWREAVVIPIHKKGKEKKNKTNYRPISLLSCLGKLMERMVNNRLTNYLESHHKINREQTGYRQHRNTEDQLIMLAQEIENAFQEKKRVVSVFFDLSKAFDKVWKKGLLQKLASCGVVGNMFYWIRNYLTDRTARVKLDGKTSHLVKLQEGIPQGGSLSPTLFLVFINDIMENVPDRISRALHADDLATWHAAEETNTAMLRMQDTVNHVSDWARHWGVQVNISKTVCTCFSLSTKREILTLTMNGKKLPQEDNPTYLGLTMDRRLTWNVQIQKSEAKATRRLALLKKLSGTTWGANSHILKTVYTGFVRPTMEYGMSTWATASKASTSQLNKVQNTGLRLITGAMKSTPIAEMEKVTGLQSISERTELKVLTHSEKLKRLPSHPASQLVSQLTKNRLKRKSFNHISKALTLQHDPKPLNLPTDREMLKDSLCLETANIQIGVDIPGIHRKADLPSATLKAITEDFLDRNYNSTKWTQIYTDGSAEDAVRNGGGGVYIKYHNGKKTSAAVPTGLESTNYRAEQSAILLAATAALSANTGTHVVFLTDSRSVLETLQKLPKDKLSLDVQRALSRLSERCTVALQWIPSHCQIHGNEEADNQAKLGSRMEQFTHSASYTEAKTMIKAHYLSKWKNRLCTDGVDKSLHGLERWQETTIFRLRTGHCQLLSHLHRIGVSHTNECPCGTGVQDPQHILQSCPIFKRERDKTWPAGQDLHSKLWGTTVELQKTSAFIQSTSLHI